jgi:alkylation response protein AidB-like acyl-CoA dehydrogenase
VDFSFTEQQGEVAELARTILEEQVSHESLTQLEASGRPRFDPRLWQRLADADLLGVGLPEALGGSELGLLTQALVLREIGRTLAPLPYLWTVAVAADTIARYGSPTQKAEWVTPAIDGRRLLSAALVEPSNGYWQKPATTAHAHDSGFLLDGTKTFVPAAEFADGFLIPAWDGEQAVVFLVGRDTPGLTVSAQATSTGDSFGEVVLDGVYVVDEARVGIDPAEGAEVLSGAHTRAVLAICALQLGVLERTLEATAHYIAERRQFDRPIATFQAVGHRAADAYIDVEAVRLSLWQAIYLVQSGEAAEVAVHTAKWWAAEAGHRVAHTAVHLHGGMGIATEHFLHRYFTHAKQNEFLLGGATEHALLIGAHFASNPI